MLRQFISAAALGSISTLAFCLAASAQIRTVADCPWQPGMVPRVQTSGESVYCVYTRQSQVESDAREHRLVNQWRNRQNRKTVFTPPPSNPYPSGIQGGSGRQGR